MKLLRFMIRKDMAKSALISLLLALLSCAFLISVLRPSYAYGEKYMTYLKGGSETVSQDAQKLADEQNALNNEINDYVLYSLGLLDPSSLNGIVRRAMAGEDISVDSEQHVYTYDELLDLKFKVVPTPYLYKKKDGVWEDMTGDESYMKKAVANGTEISVVGILRPDEDASSASISGAIGYRHDLMTYLIDEVDNSEIVKAPRAT